MKTIKITPSSVTTQAGHVCRWEPHRNLHHLEICSQEKCGKVRNVPFVWTKCDDLEAEFMGRQEELYQQREAARRQANDQQ